MNPQPAIDFDAIEREIAAGYISQQRHPRAGLRILNYTPKAQYAWRWTAETKACRGLIVDEQNQVVARPFEKFFSYDQLDGRVPDEPFQAYDKLDGTLGILYWEDECPRIASRGSFGGQQAARANAILREKYAGAEFDRRLTYLFEVIYPENRIVVDYADREDLILLAVIETETGRELPLPEIGLPVAERYENFSSLDELLQYQDDTREGFVVRFESGLRVKIKFVEYLNLQRTLTGFTARHIWKALRETGEVGELLENVPDEYYGWVKSTEARLRAKFAHIESEARSALKEFTTRREAARYIQGCRYPGIMFAMLDGNDYSDSIWRCIRPPAQRASR